MPSFQFNPPPSFTGLSQGLPAEPDKHHRMARTQYVLPLLLILFRQVLTFLPFLPVYRACELASDGRADSTAAFISRIFRLCLRSVCAPSSSTTTGETASQAAVGLGVASMPPPPQAASTSTTLAPSYPPLDSVAGSSLPPTVRFSPSSVSRLLVTSQAMLMSSFPPLQPSVGPLDPSQAFSLGNSDASYWCVSFFPSLVDFPLTFSPNSLPISSPLDTQGVALSRSDDGLVLVRSASR
jgi:hypothetical protein